MKTIDEIIVDKIFELTNYMLSKIIKPDITIKTVTQLDEKGIDYIEFAHKPLKKNFLMACQKMNLTPDKVLVVGDSLFSDIYGGKRNKMKTALVKQVEYDER